MKIAVLSGKGGTGKTTVSAGLAAALGSCQYIDCDVEEPNGAIFLKPEIHKAIPVKVPVPSIDQDRCTGCGACGGACQFNAIAVVKGKVLLFPEICHHCGACMVACPNRAISEQEREIGMVEMDKEGAFMQGRLNIGEPISIPIIRELKARVKDTGVVVLDCPPGASCSVVESIEGVDYCILVTEPTPFGLHDLKIAVQLVRGMGIPFGVVINKYTGGQTETHDYCKKENIEILMEIPFSEEFAKAYSKGSLIFEVDSEWKARFERLVNELSLQIEGRGL